MQPIFQPLIGLVLALSLATGAHAASALTVYSAAEPIALVDVSGAHWRGSDDGLIKEIALWSDWGGDCCSVYRRGDSD